MEFKARVQVHQDRLVRKIALGKESARDHSEFVPQRAKYRLKRSSCVTMLLRRPFSLDVPCWPGQRSLSGLCS